MNRRQFLQNAIALTGLTALKSAVPFGAVQAGGYVPDAISAELIADADYGGYIVPPEYAAAIVRGKFIEGNEVVWKSSPVMIEPLKEFLKRGFDAVEA